jgi:hypothetical protein
MMEVPLMTSRTLIGVPAALIALLALTAAAFAGGWASVAMADPPGDITPGQETSVELTVLQHGATPVDWPRITVVATNAESGAIVRAQAEAVKGALGKYQATLVFPGAGDWAVTYDSPDLVMDGSASLAVTALPVPAAVNAPAVTTASAATDASATLAVPIAGVAIIAILALFFAALLIRGRRSQPVEQREQPAASRG